MSQGLGECGRKEIAVFGGKLNNPPVSSVPLSLWPLPRRLIENTGENSHQAITYSRTSPVSLICTFLSSVLSIVLALFLSRLRHPAVLVLVRSNTGPRGTGQPGQWTSDRVSKLWAKNIKLSYIILRSNQNIFPSLPN